MNLSQSYSLGSEKDCKSYLFKTVSLRVSSADSFYGLLVAAAVLSLVACPFTILLNALVMVAVKTKRRLQTHPNILLACLALTDLMVGHFVQPLHITKTILLLEGKDFHEFCDIDLAFAVFFLIFVLATACHSVLISGERYLAIKHTYYHATTITKARLLVCSAVTWIAATLFFLIMSYTTIFLFIWQGTIFFSIMTLQILVYKEARRHEEQILSHQISLEARAKFEMEKKALKLTTTILMTIFLCFALPSISIFVTFQLSKELFSPESKTLVRHLVFLTVTFNSFLHPVIYSVRKREFRVAFIEFLLRKSFQEAEEFERTMFRNNAVRPQDGQDGEGMEQIAEERHANHGTTSHKDQA